MATKLIPTNVPMVHLDFNDPNAQSMLIDLADELIHKKVLSYMQPIPAERGMRYLNFAVLGGFAGFIEGEVNMEAMYIKEICDESELDR